MCRTIRRIVKDKKESLMDLLPETGSLDPVRSYTDMISVFSVNIFRTGGDA